MKEYTEKIHAGRVLRMFLHRKDIGMHCPASKQYVVPTKGISFYCCAICAFFISDIPGCPCSILGKERAINLTADALIEKGYITGKLAIAQLNKRVEYLTGEKRWK